MFQLCSKIRSLRVEIRSLTQIIRAHSIHFYAPDRGKCDKYSRDCLTNRGIINCLFRETNTFCNCMKPYKEEAKAMEKLGMCMMCDQEFPKMQLKRCFRCLAVQYP